MRVLIIASLVAIAFTAKLKSEGSDTESSDREVPNPGQQFYLGTEGYDDDDGKSPTHLNGTNSGPWKTLSHAITQIREHRPNNPGPEDLATLNILTGVYYQNSTITLTGKDSYLTIKAYNDDPVTISGGILLNNPINNWVIDGQIRTATFPLETVESCGELFHGKNRLLPARSPNVEGEWGFNKNIASGKYHKMKDLLVTNSTCKMNSPKHLQSCPDKNKDGFVFDDEFSADWDYLDQTQVVIFHSWVAEYADVSSVEQDSEGRNIVKFQNSLKHAPIGTYAKAGNYRYLIFNNKAILDHPGESVCVKTDQGVEVSYIPLDENESEVPVMANLETILFIKPPSVSNIQVSGLQFQHSSSGGADGFNVEQSAVRILKAHDITISDCEFSHVGMIGLWVIRSNRTSISNSVFFDIGYHGIKTTKIYEDILISNNLLNGCGIAHFWTATCIWADGDKNITISNNEATNVPNNGIKISGASYGYDHWNQNNVTTPNRDDYSQHVEFNHVHHFGLAILSDFGGIKTGAQESCKEVSWKHYQANCYTYYHIFNNLVHDVQAYENGGNYIYSDTSCGKNTVENNLLIGATDSGSYIYHHCGMENLSKNNIIHRNSASVTKNYMWGGCEKTKNLSYQQYTNENNIYLLENVDNLYMGRNSDRFWNHHNDNRLDQAPEFKDNLYWGTEKPTTFPGDKTWEQWTSGNDTDSVWADPLFTDIQSGDYSLMPESPAFELGIHEIILGNFGVQESLRYASSLQ